MGRGYDDMATASLGPGGGNGTYQAESNTVTVESVNLETNSMTYTVHVAESDQHFTSNSKSESMSPTFSDMMLLLSCVFF